MTRLAPILLVLIAFAALSCNGDEAPSQEEYAEQANEICREAKDSLENLGEEARNRDDVPGAINRVIEEARQTVDELADLELPEGDAAERAERFVDATRAEIQGTGIPALEDLRRAFERGDQEALQEAIQRLRQIDSSASNRAARAVGASDCGER
jgi:hypothetical protein